MFHEVGMARLLFSILDESGEMIANGSAIDFIRHEQKNDTTTREQAAEQLFVFNQHFEKKSADN
jgi:hypothetical protein